MKFILLLSTVSLFGLKFVQTFSCSPCDNPEEICGKPPSCCKSGYYTEDRCGCCKTCAKAEDEVCGGPWDTAGVCSSETVCLRSWECKTTSNNICVFPFKFKGKTYSECTKDESVNDRAWCATKVDRSGNVVNGKWEDCQEGCPGTSFDIRSVDVQSYLGNEEGICISKRRATASQRKVGTELYTIRLDRSPSGQEKAPKCSQVGKSHISSPPSQSPPLPNPEDCSEIKERRVCCSDSGECSGYTGPDPTPWQRAKFTSCEYSDGHLRCDFTNDCSRMPNGRTVCCEDGGDCSAYVGPNPRDPLCSFTRNGPEVCA